MPTTESRVTIHMAASLDGFIAREGGAVDWLETSDLFEPGETLDPEFVQQFLESIGCYVMGSHTYETALAFEANGQGWAYGETPVFVLTRRALPKTDHNIHFCSGDLTELVNARLRPRYSNIWVAGGGAVAGECLRRDLADEIAYTIAPVLIGAGIPFFQNLDKDIALHLLEVRAYKSGMVALRHAIRR